LAAVVYDGDATGTIYFPLRYRFGPQLRQYQASDGANDDPMGPQLQDLSQPQSQVRLSELRSEDLIVVDNKLMSAGEITEALRTGGARFTESSVTVALRRSGHWLTVAESRYVAFAGCRVTVFHRAGPADSPPVAQPSASLYDQSR
jgi:hypothetical protein